MRSWTQIAVIAAVGAAAAGWHFYGAAIGLPPPMALLGLTPQSTQATAARGTDTGAIGVAVSPVRQGLVVQRTESVGTARAREAVTVTTRVSGIIAAIRFEEGQTVRAGQELIALDTGQPQAELDQARALSDDARTQLVRARQLRASQAVSEARIDQLEALARQAEGRVRQAEAKLAEMRVIAPFDGRVGIRQVSLGALVPPGTVVTTLDDTSRIRVEFFVPEVFSAQVREGMLVQAGSPAFGDRRFTGVVAVVDTRIDPATRAVKLIGEFDNADGAIRPGLFMTVALTLDRREQALIVSENAIDPIADKAFVFVIRNGIAVRQEVRLGTRLLGEVEVLSGLAAGEPVVVRGLQRLRPNVPVQIVETLRPSV